MSDSSYSAPGNRHAAPERQRVPKDYEKPPMTLYRNVVDGSTSFLNALAERARAESMQRLAPLQAPNMASIEIAARQAVRQTAVDSETLAAQAQTEATQEFEDADVPYTAFAARPGVQATAVTPEGPAARPVGSPDTLEAARQLVAGAFDA